MKDHPAPTTFFKIKQDLYVHCPDLNFVTVLYEGSATIPFLLVVLVVLSAKLWSTLGS
jgi:hypothetical protein